MPTLNLQSRQISLDLPGPGPELDAARRRVAAHPQDESADALRAARGILTAVGISACLWLVVLAAVTFL